MSTQQHPRTDVFYGDRPAFDSERRAVSLIRAELERRGIPALLLVNFFLPRGARQLDLVIVTAGRCVVVELKSLDADLPLTATVNGPWQHILPDGTRRAIGDRNFYIQAKEQTYGLSDCMTALAKNQRVPGPVKKSFFRQIDTVVAIGPRIPAGSQLQKFDYVEAIGLDTVVDALTKPGRGLTHWTRSHWDELIRELGLYPETDASPEAQRRRADHVAVQDYQRRFRQALSARLQPLVAAGGSVDGQAATIDAAAVTAPLTQPASRVLVLGASGDGKTHTARHAAAQLTDAGHVVVWLSADDYRKNEFGVLLSRAVSPYSTEAAWALLHKAADSGIVVVIIVDALQASPHHEELLSQLNALLLKLPASALVTASRDEDTSDLFTPSTRITLFAPDVDERIQIAANFGNSAAGTDFDGYRTRYDISVAAQVIADLPAGASRTDVLDAYISQMAPQESVRAGLRCLATAMDKNVATVMAINEAAAVLRRCPPLKADPAALDAVLASRLVATHQGRLRFSHERQGRFLAAEHLVISSADGAALGDVLASPEHADLRHDALGLEREPARRYDALRALADEELIAAAAMGRFGYDTARLCRAEMTELLITARLSTAQAVFEEPASDDEFWSCTWHCPRPWSPIEQSLLRAIGRCVLGGLLIDEVGELLDATDKVLRPAMSALRDNGSRISISIVFASAYAHQHPRTADALPATYICGTIDTERHWGDWPESETALATRMWRPNPSWGRLHAAALLSRPLRHPDDVGGALDLIRAGWRAGGYHLHLGVLEAARFAHHVVPEQDRHAIADFLDTIDASHNIGLSSLLLEVLGLYGRIQPANSLEDINAEIAEVIDDPDDPRLQQLAVSVVSRQYEDESVFGPYAQAVNELPLVQRLTLNAMAVLAPATTSASATPVLSANWPTASRHRLSRPAGRSPTPPEASALTRSAGRTASPGTFMPSAAGPRWPNGYPSWYLRRMSANPRSSCSPQYGV